MGNNASEVLLHDNHRSGTVGVSTGYLGDLPIGCTTWKNGA